MDLRKSPTQDRATATFEAIVDAAAHILAKDGPPGLTTNKIAERAGVSIGSLYQYFPNKQAVVRALLQRQVRRAEAARPDVLDDPRASTETVVRAAVDWWFDMHAAEPALTRHLQALAMELLPPHERQRLADLRHDRLRRTVARLLGQDDRLDQASFIFDVCLSEISARAQRQRPEWLASGGFRAEVAKLLVRYVR
jgi:AcrR family transcriptional regulator